MDESEVPSFLFDGVSRIIKELEAEAVRTMGVTLYYRKLSLAPTDSDIPAVKMGWAQFHRAGTPREDWKESKGYPHVLCITQDGLDVVDSLRASKGYVSVNEQLKINREADSSRWEVDPL
jgi:hypothetical protein